MAVFRHRISIRVPLVIGLFGALVAVMIAIQLPKQIEKFVEEVALKDALTSLAQIKELRSYYTKNVIGPVQLDGTLIPHFSHEDDDRKIPLPATMVHELSDRFSFSGRAYKLSSPYPFPHREGSSLDSFQTKAWGTLVDAPSSYLSQTEVVDGEDVLRVAIADVMAEETCVACHNTHPDSPKVDWALGDVRGVLEINLNLTGHRQAGQRFGLIVALVLMLGSLTAALWLAVYLRKSVLVPIENISLAARTYATGDVSQSVAGADRDDEIGNLASALEVFRKQAVEVQQLQAERQAYSQMLEQQVDERTADLQKVATELEMREQVLAEAYTKISSSINYAGNIQKSLLTPDKLREELLGDSFIVWEPRDVVGGDMYWIRRWGNGALVALGDCTGHGVPGAFMTLIATTALNLSLQEAAPGQVSYLMHLINRNIRSILGQDRAESLSDDGMDVGVVYLPYDSENMTFCGAGFVLFGLKKGQVEQFKTGRFGVGYGDIPSDHRYKEVSISRTAYDGFFMSTDGLFDQAGGEKGFGFGKRRFSEILQAQTSLDMVSVRGAVLKALADYQGDEQRRDDLCIIGFSGHVTVD